MMFRFLSLLLILALPVIASAQDVRDRQFEKTIRQINPKCMPAPYPTGVEFYPLRVGKAALANCGTEEQVRKYSSYIVNLSRNPAVTADMIQDLKSDAAKCVLKTFVDADASMNSLQKEDVKAVIDGAFTLSDWYGFVKSLPELRTNDADAFITTLMSSRDRVLDLEDFYQSDLGGRIVDTVLGARRKHLALLGYHRDRCDYGEAWSDLENALAATEDECVYAGHAYRQAEKNLVEHMNANRHLLETPFGSGDEAKAQHNRLLQFVAYQKERLGSFRRKYDELDRIERAMRREAKGFLDRRTDYRIAVRQAGEDIPAAASCTDLRQVDRALALANGVKPLCRAAFYGSGGDTLVAPQTLMDALARTGQERSAQYSKLLDDIRAYGNACNLSARETAIKALRSALSGQPVLQYQDGVCRVAAKPYVQDALDRMAGAIPVHCQMTEVPLAILGESTSEALRLLEEARLFALGPATSITPAPDQASGIVVGSTPAPGQSARVWTGVRLLVTGPQPETASETAPVSVPTVVGLSWVDARDALAEVGLVAIEGRKIPADKITLKPGFVQSATPAAGTPVPPGSAVTLTVIGPRPMIEVPSLAAAKTLADAQSILTGAGFTAGPLAAGDPAPEGETPGTFYGTVPPGPGPYEMFTQVSPLAYTLPVAPPPEPAPEPPAQTADPQPGGAGDGTWLGLWELTDFTSPDRATEQGLSGAVLRFRVTDDQGDVMFALFTNRNGQWKRFFQFPAVIDANNVLRPAPSILREMQAELAADSARGDVDEMARMIFGALKELKMTRDRFDCTIRLFDVRGGRMVTLHARCTRQ